MLQLISNANKKESQDASLDSLLFFHPQTIVALRQSRPGCSLLPSHWCSCGGLFLPPISNPTIPRTHVVQQQTRYTNSRGIKATQATKETKVFSQQGLHLWMLPLGLFAKDSVENIHSVGNTRLITVRHRECSPISKHIKTKRKWEIGKQIAKAKH